MGNVVGEKFDDFVIDQINARQSLAGKGFGEATLSPSDLLLLNNRNAWLKLASSVNVFNNPVPKGIQGMTPKARDLFLQQIPTLGTQRLIDIGIGAGEAPDYLGSQLAQKSVLFNTLSEFTPTTYKKNEETGELTDQIDIPGSYNFRSGVSKSDSLWNSSNSYGLGGSNFGLTPAPGLISAKVDNKNRGSIRTAEIEIKAYNKFQFEMLELVYLRLGFTMMLEWGWDKYTTDGKTITNMGNTIVEDSWFSDNPSSQLDMLETIQSYRNLYNGNYDGFFGKVVNFDWNFNKNGTYSITLKLVTLGDVVESIKTNSTATTLTQSEISSLILSADDNEKERLTRLQESSTVSNAGSSPLAQSLFIDIINPNLWGNTNKNYFSFNNQRDAFESSLPTALERTQKGAAVGSTTGIGINQIAGALYGGFSGLINDGPQNPLQSNDRYSYYMTFDILLSRINQYCIPSIGTESNPEKQISVLPRGNNNLCSAFPNQISFDPRVCLIKPIFTPNMVGSQDTSENNIKYWSWFSKLADFGTLAENKTLLYGNIMNIYLNYDFISTCLSQNMDKDGSISIYKFLTRICDGINSSLGNFQKLEAVIRDEVFVTIQDQNPIPGLELLYPDIKTDNITPFEVFGFNTTGSISSNFVTDFGFNTKITPQLATSISIGTTANNVTTKNYDGTVFSKWNTGLQDRFSSFFEDPSQIAKVKSTFVKDSPLTQEQIDAEWEAWESRARRDSNQRNSQIYRAAGKELNVYGHDGTPTNSLNQYTNKITSPLNGKTYKDNAFSGVLNWPQYITKVIEDYEANKERLKNKQFTIEELNEIHKSSYKWYLIRAFSGKLSSSDATSLAGTITELQSQYFLMENSFIEDGKSVFQSYINTNITNAQFNSENLPSNTIGYIPADVNLTFKGLSGIKIYQQLRVRQDFLPKQYPKSLKFLIKGVNHSISNNDWSTNINTLSIPNVEAALNLDGTPKYNNVLLSDGLINEPTPNATELRNYLQGGISVINNNFFEKGNEISNNGDISARLKDSTIALLQSLNEAISKILPPLKPIEIRITAGNDTSHSGSSSRHPEGNALDFTLGPPINPTWGAQLTALKTYNINGKNIILPAGPLPKYPSSQYEYINLIDKAMVDFVKNNLGTNYINEYYNPSSGASGPHFHFSVRDNFVEI
tara:strand:+ start:6 stop:3503 length:3498 start_codon:yes stop_codon:yes gene_type:complete